MIKKKDEFYNKYKLELKKKIMCTMFHYNIKENYQLITGILIHHEVIKLKEN